MTFSIKTLLLITAFVAALVALLLKPNLWVTIAFITFTIGVLFAGTVYWVVKGKQTPAYIRAGISVSWMYLLLIVEGPLKAFAGLLGTTHLIEALRVSAAANHHGLQGLSYYQLGQCVCVWIIGLTTAVIVKILTKNKTKVPA